MAQCYKVLIDDTCSFEDVWYGRNAKIFEGCELSQDGNDEVELEFNTFEFKEKQEDMTWIGTSEPYSDVYCKPLPLIGTTTAGGTRESNISLWAKQAYLAATNWYELAYGKNKKTSKKVERTFQPPVYVPHFQLPW